MKRSFSIGLTAALVLFLHLPQAHAAYTREAWVHISNVALINANWVSDFATAKVEIQWDENSSGGIYSGANYTKDEGSSITSVSLSHSGTYAEASATAQIPTVSTEDWAEVFAGASKGTGSPGPYSWGEGIITLERHFTVIDPSKQVQLEFRFDYGIKTDTYMGAGVYYDFTLGSAFVPIKVWAAGESSDNLNLAGYYTADQTGTVRLLAEARAWASADTCAPPIPAPVAVVLASVGVVTVVVLRRRRVI